MSRLHSDVATSSAAHFFSSGRNLSSLLQPNFLLPTFILGRDLKVMSRPLVALFLIACSPNCSKVVATLIYYAQLFFRSQPKRVVATSFVVLDL